MSFKNEAEAMLTGINVDMMNETVWTDYLVWSLWSDTVDGDCHLYPVDQLRICDMTCHEGGNKPRTVVLCSVMSNSLGPTGLQLSKLLCPWNFFFFDAGIPEQVAISSSTGSSWFRDQTHVSCICCIVRQILYH